MPNWCFNQLRITGPADQLAAFRDKANNSTDFPKWKGEVEDEAEPGQDYHLNFNALYPVPTEVQAAGYQSEDSSPLDIINGPPTTTGYGWSIANWGTKWNSGGAELKEEQGANGQLIALEYEFDTAWDPPTGVISHAAGDFPALRFELDFREPGNGFAGRLVCEGGKEVENNRWDYQEEDEEADGEEGEADAR